MNVLDVLDTIQPEPLDLATIQAMLDQRAETHQGFAELEKDQGFITPFASLSTSKGQEMGRILLLRFLEELTEAAGSIQRAHVQEEIIDALNYLWNIAILDKSAPRAIIAQTILGVLQKGQWRGGVDLAFRQTELGDLVLQMGRFLETFRNRAWQNNPQSAYFDGWPAYQTFLAQSMHYCMHRFSSWDEFYCMWQAKDQVLQFRIRTKY